MAISTKASRHYTGMDIFNWCWTLWAVEMVEYDVFTTAGQTHRRLTVLNAVMLHLFTGRTNWTHGEGWEVSAGTLRRGHWVKWLLNWSVGWVTPGWGFGQDRHNLRRYGKLAVCLDTDAPRPKYVHDELTFDMPRYYATPAQARHAKMEREMDAYYARGVDG